MGLQGKDNIFGSGSGLIVLDNVMCEGNETNLLMCGHNAIFQSNCDHAQDAAVICEGKISFLTGLAVYYIMLVQQSFIAHFFKHSLVTEKVTKKVERGCGTEI